MYYQKDWFMCQIQTLIQKIAQVVFNKDSVKYEIEDVTSVTETDILYARLTQLLSEYEICKAEDLLFDNVEPDNKKFLILALDFYSAVNTFTDAELREANFTRSEIDEGLNEILATFNISLEEISKEISENKK